MSVAVGTTVPVLESAAQAIVARTRATQGLPPTVEDIAALNAVATVLAQNEGEGP
jgi:hypothetical protein